MRERNSYIFEWLQRERPYILVYIYLQVLENKLGDLLHFPVLGTLKQIN